MGNCNIADKQELATDSSVISIKNFEFMEVLGKGGFGKVWKVRRRKNKTLFALKVMSKLKVIVKKSVSSVLNERTLLSQVRNPFMINMIGAFQDRDNLYLIMDLLSGGDLRYHIGKNRRFNEEQTKFFVACLVVALDYLHQNGIIHRDIKPENLVFDNSGYLRLTDLGIARIWRPENAQDTSGTPGYMAPEVMCRQNHGIAVDFFALGVIVYECMLGKRPYQGKSRQEIRDQMLSKQVQIKRQEVPISWTLEAADFANRLIQRKPNQRLGGENPDEVKQHPWFKDFEWDKLLSKELTPPYTPVCSENMYGLTQDTIIESESQIILRRNSIQGMYQTLYQAQFNGYACDANDNMTTECLKY